MANINFNEENVGIRRANKATASTGFARKLISWGLAKNENQANMYMIAFIIVGIGITIFNFTRIH
jgi:hypothetical protein